MRAHRKRIRDTVDSDMKHTTQGSLLIGLLIAVAILGLIAATLLPNLLGAQQRKYDERALLCAKSIQTAQAVFQIDEQTFTDLGSGLSKLNGATEGLEASCRDANMIVTQPEPATQTAYTIRVGDRRGSKTYTITPDRLDITSGVLSGATALPAN